MGLNSTCRQIRVGALCAFALCCYTNSAVAEISVPNSFVDGQPAIAADVNDNFDALAQAINTIKYPEGEYSVLSQEELDSGLVRTTIYAYEESHFSNEQYFVDPSVTWYESTDYIWVSEGHETTVNALGHFTSSYRYVVESDDDLGEGLSSVAPTSCPDGTEIPRETSFTIRYTYSLVSAEGTLAFSNVSSDEAGVFVGCDPVQEYYYLEGAGTGRFQCIDRAAYYGAFNGGGGNGWDKLYVAGASNYPRVVTGSFDKDSNGQWGTYYIEIDAPADCLTF